MTGLATTVLADGWGLHHNLGTGGWIVMMLGMLIFWGALIALVVWLVRGGLASRNEPPHDVLRRRLADGSISVEEYEQRRDALESSNTTAGGDDIPRAGTTGGPTTAGPSPST